ncbi:MAG: esterase [Microbacteriaceae bacterium]|nr:esterase [Microbacteriaceae bacterium]
MALNEDVVRVLQLMGADGPDPLLPATDDPAELAPALAALRSRPKSATPENDGVNATDIVLDSGIMLRVYDPSGATRTDRAVVLFMHGGGWVMGDIDMFDSFCREVAASSELVVASLNYRLAPEHPFPAAFEDTVEAFHWIRDHASEHGGDSDRIIVMGSSAGGALAAAVAAAEGRGNNSPIILQVLIYPALDSRLTAKSLAENASGYYLTRRQMTWYWDQYTPDAKDKRDPRASPPFAESLVGVPAALVITAEFDPLRDEGKAYADQLRADGVSVEYVNYAGQIHGFMAMMGVVSGAREAVHFVAHSIAKAARRGL